MSRDLYNVFCSVFPPGGASMLGVDTERQRYVTVSVCANIDVTFKFSSTSI